jgi:hypothetical protein
MTSSRLSLAFSLVAAFLAGCGSSTTAVSGLPGGAALEPALGARHESWMSPQATQATDLLYVSNSRDVTVYTYKNGNGINLVGTLTGFSSPKGMCSDKAGNVWIADYDNRTVFEYAHGATSPKRLIKTSVGGGYPYACAVAPSNNDLAISYEHPNGKYAASANVVVYPGEKAPRYKYTSYTGLFQTYFLAYDNAGNLFLDASPCISYCYESGGPPGLFELAKNATLFVPVPISGVTLYQPTAIVYLDPALLIGDVGYSSKGRISTYKILVTKFKGTLDGSVPFPETQTSYGFTRRGLLAIVPDLANDIVRTYEIPSGQIQSSFTAGLSAPFAAVISQRN